MENKKFSCKKGERYNFAKIPLIMEVPNLIKIQTESYANFLQKDIPPDQRKNEGLEGIFRSIFPNPGRKDLEKHQLPRDRPHTPEREVCGFSSRPTKTDNVLCGYRFRPSVENREQRDHI